MAPSFAIAANNTLALGIFFSLTGFKLHSLKFVVMFYWFFFEVGEGVESHRKASNWNTVLSELIRTIDVLILTSKSNKEEFQKT